MTERMSGHGTGKRLERPISIHSEVAVHGMLPKPRRGIVELVFRNGSVLLMFNFVDDMLSKIACRALAGYFPNNVVVLQYFQFIYCTTFFLHMTSMKA